MKNVYLLILMIISTVALKANYISSNFTGSNIKASISLGHQTLLFQDNVLKQIDNYNNENNQSLSKKKAEKIILKFIGANLNSKIEYEQSSPITIYSSNKTYREKVGKSILIRNIYNFIDLRLRYSQDNNIKYDLILHPGSNVEDIQIKTSDEQVARCKYQTEELKSFVIDGNRKKYIHSTARIQNRILKFELYNHPKNKTIIIDPEVSFSTFYGGSGNDEFLSQKFLEDGSYVITGHSTSSSFPLEDGQTHYSSAFDIIIMKFSSENELMWSTILSGSSNEYGRDILVDYDGNIWVVGQTASYNFPITSNAISTKYQGGIADGFITKLSPEGQLLYSTFFGSSSYESLLGLAIDSKGNIWSSGQTAGNVTITSNAYSKIGNLGYDGFVVKVDQFGKLLLSCYVAGDSDEACENICMSPDDNPVISGWSGSSNIGIKNGTYTAFMGYRDAIIMKVDKNTGEPIWGSYFGGSSDDRSYDISFWDGSYYITGRTRSENLPTTINSFQKTIGGNQDNFVAKFKEWGILEWCSYYGGSGSENETGEASYLYGTAVNDRGDLLFSGRTSSHDLPITYDAFQIDFGGGYDSFIAKVSSSGELLYSSYVGGSGNEVAWNCDYDTNGEMFLLGYTWSNDFPVTENAIDEVFNGATDAYILRFGNPCHQSAFELGAEPVSSFAFNGNATYNNDTLVMHPQIKYLEGSVWYDKLMPINAGFVSEFKFRMTRNDNIQNAIEDPGSTEGGLAFVIQNSSTTALGETDFGIGYMGIPNGIAIEFDSYKNDEDSYDDQNDPSDGHIAVMGMSAGALSSHHDAQKTFANVELKDDSTVYHCKVKYDGIQQKLTIYFAEDGQALKEVISLTIDLSLSIDLKDDAWAYIGFTAANGSVAQTHDIFDWSVCPSPDSPDTGIEDYAGSESNVFIFPNPTNDNITIHYAPEKMSYTNISLYDIAGIKLAILYNGLDNPGEQTISMPLPADLAPGVYIVELNYGYARESVKVIVK